MNGIEKNISKINNKTKDHTTNQFQIKIKTLTKFAQKELKEFLNEDKINSKINLKQIKVLYAKQTDELQVIQTYDTASQMWEILTKIERLLQHEITKSEPLKHLLEKRSKIKALKDMISDPNLTNKELHDRSAKVYTEFKKSTSMLGKSSPKSFKITLNSFTRLFSNNFKNSHIASQKQQTTLQSASALIQKTPIKATVNTLTKDSKARAQIKTYKTQIKELKRAEQEKVYSATTISKSK